MISTMESYFRGERELFQGLAIDRLEPEEWIKYPVLRLDLTRGGYNNPDDLPKFLGKMVDAWEKEYDTSHPDQTPDWRFDKIIHDIYEQTGRQVVILIDEYDSPIVDSHGNLELEAANRKTLHDFYRVMKANEDCLKFVFLTGVGKIGQINVFSGLNNLKDSTPEKALEQINEKEYDLLYENSLNSKRIVKVRVNISPDTRNIDGWAIA